MRKSREAVTVVTDSRHFHRLPSLEYRIRHHRFGNSLDRRRRHRRELELRIQFRAHCLSQQNVLSMLARERLHARGEVQRWADHRVLAALTAPDEPGQPRAAVNAYPDSNALQSIALQLRVVAYQRSAYGKRGFHCVIALPGIGLQHTEKN